jgi:site-specific recombinase XerD
MVVLRQWAGVDYPGSAALHLGCALTIRAPRGAVEQFSSFRSVTTFRFAKMVGRTGRSGRHLRGLRWNLERFADAQGKEKDVHEVQRHSVESWLNAQSFSLKTRANYLRDLGILFNFALSRRWTAENPCAFIEKPSELEREVSALTPEERVDCLPLAPMLFFLLSA